MALNQTQRDHAIIMIKSAVACRRQEVSIKSLSEKDFVDAHIKANDIQTITIDELYQGVVPSRYGSDSFSMLKVFGLQDYYDAHIADVAATNKKGTEKFYVLEEELVGEVMFGNDYSVISDALKRIADCK